MAQPHPSSESLPYVTITADTHAGASVDAYREYLDEGQRREFDAWRGGYSNPSHRHVGRKKAKNWDSSLRWQELEQDGVVAEVIFPNTVPPFYERAFHISPPPGSDDYRRKLAGTRAHNRWLPGRGVFSPAGR